MTLVIQGETPPKKNSRINTRSGRSFPNRRYMDWLHSALAQVMRQVEGKPWQWASPDGLELTCTFYHGDMKRRDSDNQLSSVLDMLVEAQVIDDDSWVIIPVKHVYDAYDKGNPRCVISLEALGKV